MPDITTENEVAEARRQCEEDARGYCRQRGIDPVGYLMGEGFCAEQIIKFKEMFDISLPELAKAYAESSADKRRDMLMQYRPEEDKPPEDDILARLGAYTIGSLTESEREPPNFLVDRLVPVGLTFLSGAPKIRKSFMALQIASAVASGRDFLGFKTKPCDVLYFDLEGSKSRAASRSERMDAQVPENVYIVNRTDTKLADGLADIIRALHEQKPRIRLFIIDTYSRARGMVKSMGANAYDADVAFLEPLQRMATDENIAILCVHHDRKGAGTAQDSFERLSGTMGISGSADCVLNLVAEGKRFEGRAKLEYSPRDAMGGELNLMFDERICEWQRDTMPQPELLGNPIIAYCIDHAPAKSKEGCFISYDEVYRGSYKTASQAPGEEVTRVLKKNLVPIYQEYGIGIQLGVKSHGIRGLRLFRVI